MGTPCSCMGVLTIWGLTFAKSYLEKSKTDQVIVKMRVNGSSSAKLAEKKTGFGSSRPSQRCSEMKMMWGSVSSVDFKNTLTSRVS